MSGCLLTCGSLATAARPVEEATARSTASSLTDVIQLATQRAPDVLLGAANVRIGEAAYAGARIPALGNPYLELTVERDYAIANQSPGILGSIWLPIEVNGQRARRIEEVDALVRWRTAELGQTKARIVGAAIYAYGASLVGTRRIEVLSNIAATAQREAAFYRARVASGDALLREAKLAETEAARSRALIEEARADLERQLLRLNRITGMSYENVAPAAIEPPSPESLANQSVERAPLVLASRAEERYFERSRQRAEREGLGPVSLIIQLGRGGLGDARVGGGVAYTIPTFRRNQAETARAEAERSRSSLELSIRRAQIERHSRALRQELARVRDAERMLTTDAIPAVEAAVEAAVETQRAGKGDWLTVLVSRRDLGALYLKRLELFEREWLLVGQLVELGGVKQ